MTIEPVAHHVHGLPYDSPRSSKGQPINYAAELQDRMPIRQEKLEKFAMLGSRDSKLSLRNMFAKSRSTLADPMAVFRSAGSSVPISSLPLSRRPLQHQSSLPAGYLWKPLPLPVPDQDPDQRQSKEPCETASIKSRRPASISRSQYLKEAPRTWSLPPLFRAFTEAVRHANLPATSSTAVAMARINGRKKSVRQKRSTDAMLGAMGLDHDAVEGDGEKSSKKNRRNQQQGCPAAELRWTRKIYILVASGYLLQYAAEGTYDRLPDKVIRLGPSSAAFATDAIPGCHWVIQVSSVADMDGASSSAEARSLLSRLSFRVEERRTVNNLLMVFENAESMEGWITALRTEIGRQGGRKKLSETGSADELPREHVHPGTGMARDASPLTTSSAASMSGRDARASTVEGETRHRGTPTQMSRLERTRNLSLDEMSTTNSVVSQDERCLDSLRESCTRFSLNSCGQRTFVTSCGSSLNGSPIHEKFGDVEARPADVRARLNALESASRRREPVQAMNPPLSDDGSSPRGSYRGGASHHVSATEGPRMVSPVGDAKPTPNFSLPHAPGRRISSAMAGPRNRSETNSPDKPQDGDHAPRRLGRLSRLSRMQTMAMPSVHRLRVVTDGSATRPIATERLHGSRASTTSPVAAAADAPGQRSRSVSRVRATQPAKDKALPDVPRVVLPGSMPDEVDGRRHPRQYVSTTTLRHGASTWSLRSFCSATRTPHIASLMVPGYTTAGEEPRGRRRPSFLGGGDVVGVDGDGQQPRRAADAGLARRVSSGFAPSSRTIAMHNSSRSVTASRSQSLNARAVSACPPKSERRWGHDADVVEKRSRSSCVRNRSSMPQMGGPPGPPPTKDLPPLPRDVHRITRES